MSDQTTSAASVPSTGGDPKTIQVRKASYWYDDVIGINDLSADIGPGVTGLLGPNGAGKSTLMKVISGQLTPRTGAVRIGGRPLAGHPEVFADIGFVPEFDAFWRGMTGRQFVVYLTRLHGFRESEANAAAERAIDRVGLTDAADRPVSEYSKGMRQRIKVAQALAHEPTCLLLDEPLNGTDPVGRRHTIDLIRELGEDGTTVVVSSHVLHEIEQMTDEVILIHSGRVLADGHIQEIRDLIDEHPHTIHVDCDRPRELAGKLVSFDDVVRLELAEDHVRVATLDPAACYDRIPRLALQNDFGFKGMTSPDNDLDAVFQYLVD